MPFRRRDAWPECTTLAGRFAASSISVQQSHEANEPFADDSVAPDVRLVGLVRRFGDFAAVDGVSLDIARGEFFTLLGPSGSGKTTTLRLIAGFELPDDASSARSASPSST